MAEALIPAAQAAYAAYCEAVGGRDQYHHPLEPYAALPDVYKHAWEAAAHAALVLGVDALPPPPEVEPPTAPGLDTHEDEEEDEDHDAPRTTRGPFPRRRR